MEQVLTERTATTITNAIVKADFNIELSRLKYQEMIQYVENIVWDRENVHKDMLAEAKLVAKKLSDKKDEMKRPYIDAGKIIQEEFNNLYNPLIEVINRKVSEKRIIAEKIQKENDIAAAEAERIGAINERILNFIVNITNEITESDDAATIVNIEKRIGSETARTGVYMEFIPLLKQKCNEIKPLISRQKDFIRSLKKIESEKQVSIKSGDENSVLAAMESAQDLRSTIDENKILIQEKALNVVESANVVVATPTTPYVRASRTWWTWEVKDVSELYKKQPDMVELVPNKNKIDEFMKRLKEDGTLEDKKEVVINGVRYYENKSFR